MKLYLAVLLIASAVLIVLSEDAPEIRNDALEKSEETGRACAEAYRSCDDVKCCKNRPCKCNIVGYNCKCKEFLCELFETCKL
uniref:U44-Sparatoxin-Hju1a_1 n=1 Tax=Heteropoda jugulans TaxID=1358901 RepID=A0A4Q8KAB0_9ARAC